MWTLYRISNGENIIFPTRSLKYIEDVFKEMLEEEGEKIKSIHDLDTIVLQPKNGVPDRMGELARLVINEEGNPENVLFEALFNVANTSKLLEIFQNPLVQVNTATIFDFKDHVLYLPTILVQHLIAALQSDPTLVDIESELHEQIRNGTVFILPNSVEDFQKDEN